MPFLSLILPCYNVEAYVERCVRSILEQPYGDYEIILVDDGSNDATPKICDQLAMQNACISVIHKENGGLSSARNAGLATAQGQYIWFVDSDDWIESNSLTLLHEACEDGFPDIVKFGYYRVAVSKYMAELAVAPSLFEGQAQLDDLRRMAFCQPGKYSLSAWSHVYKRSFLQEYDLTFVSERIVCSEDYLFNLQALMHVKKLRVLNEPLYTYELRAGSLTQTYKPDLLQRYAELYLRLRGYCKEYEKLVDRFYVWHLVAGTCIPHEYGRVSERPLMKQARINVLRLLCTPRLKKAIICSDKAGLVWRKAVQLCAMLIGFEPLFYYLHVKKHARIRCNKGNL